MPISFPTSPTNGQTYTYNSKTWTYNSSTLTWDANTTASIATAVAPITYNASTQSVAMQSSPTFTGDVSATGGIAATDHFDVKNTAAPTGSRWTRIGNYSDGNFVIARFTDAGSYSGNIMVGFSTGDISFATSTTGGTERMRINANGYVTMPNQVYFSAQNGANSTAAGNDVVFNVVNKNIGSAYNATNGTFTAPVAGVYDFNAWSLLNNAGSGEYRLNFYKNGGSLEGARWIFQKSGSVWYSAQIHGTFYLAANDFVTVRYESGTGGMYTDQNYTGFQARLVQ